MYYFFIALQFMTRLTVPPTDATAKQDLGKAAAYFPLVGVIVGLSAAMTFVLLRRVLPLPACVLGAMIVAAFVTNGLHEDGFADVFDGFGGGWTKERTLQIMRDSRLGVYGVLALIFLVLFKLQLLSTLAPDQIWRWFVVGHTAGRWAPLALGAWLPPASDEGLGRLVAQRSGVAEMVIGTITVIVALLATLPWQAASIAFLVTVLVTLISGSYFRSRIGGVTGDCMGAAVQFVEVTLYLTAVLLLRWTFI